MEGIRTDAQRQDVLSSLASATNDVNAAFGDSAAAPRPMTDSDAAEIAHAVGILRKVAHATGG